MQLLREFLPAGDFMDLAIESKDSSFQVVDSAEQSGNMSANCLNLQMQRELDRSTVNWLLIVLLVVRDVSYYLVDCTLDQLQLNCSDLLFWTLTVISVCFLRKNSILPLINTRCGNAIIIPLGCSARHHTPL
jgi:hypothetical protein